MNLNKFLFCCLFLFLTSNIFAQDKKIVLFFENIESVPSKILNKIKSSDKLCISATINNPKNISHTVKDLIITNKIEPTLNIEEPYFKIISDNISVNKEISFDRREDINILTSNYKQNIRKTFEKRKLGLFLRNGILDDNTLDMFYKQNIYWTTTKLKNNLNKTAFIKNNVVVFVPFTDLPKESKDIEKWLSNINAEFIPIFVNKTNTENEKLISSLLNSIEKQKNYDVYLPVNLAYYIANNTKQADTLKFELTENIPQEVLLKIAAASKEIDEQKEKGDNEQLVSLIYGELTNMYSYDIINGILNNNKFSKKLFDISYDNIFKLCGKDSSDMDKIIQKNLKNTDSYENNNKKADEYIFKEDNYGYKIINDNIIKSFGIYKNSQSVKFNINYDTNEADSLYIYIDMNNISYAGNQKLLQNLGFFVPENCWEYVIEINDKNFTIYRFIVDKTNKVAELEKESQNTIEVPITIFRGNPYNWNYQVVAVKDNNIADFLETSKIKKEKVFKSKPLLLRMMNIK